MSTALITLAALLMPMLMFRLARKADRELPPAELLPMKFASGGADPLQEEPRKVALFLFPWLAVALIIVAATVLLLVAAPPQVALATQGAFALGPLTAQLMHNALLRRYLARRS
ncbi:MAG: hypothetical protein ACTHKM_13325 [Tsuneonella sp.]